MREICLLLILVVIVSQSALITSRVLPAKDLEYRRMLQEIVGGADSPLGGFPVAMFLDRLPAPAQTYW